MEEKQLIQLYLEYPFEDLELSIGRVLASAGDDTYRAGTDEDNKIRKLVEAYFEKHKAKFKEIICDKLELDKKLSSEKFNFELEGAVLIAEILEQSEFVPVPLSYPLLAVWLMRKKVYELCD